MSGLINYTNIPNYIKDSRHIIIICDAKGFIKYVNPYSLDIFGKTSVFFMDKTINNFLLDEDKDRIFKIIRKNEQATSDPLDLTILVENKQYKFIFQVFPQVDDAQNVQQFLIMGVERHNLENELKEKNMQLNMALSNSKLALWDWNLKEHDSFHDQEYYKMLGYDITEGHMENFSFDKYIHPEDVPKIMELLNAHIEGLTPYYEAVYRIKNKEGEWRWMLDKGRIVEKDISGNPIRAIGTHLDVTKEKNVEIQLRQSEEHYRTLVETSKDIIFTLDLTGKFQYVNKSFQTITNYPPSKILGHSVLEVIKPSDRPSTTGLLKQLLNGESVQNIERYAAHSKGHYIPFEVNASPIVNSEGRPIAILAVARDVSEHNKTKLLLEEKAQNLQEMMRILENSLKEKDILVKEIHHRVKNNLQIISAITYFHEMDITDLKTKQIFKEFQQRIKAMAVIHETLYKSDNLEFINIPIYINTLLKNLRLSFQVNPDKIKILEDMDEISLDLGIAMHIGLIINELVSNIFKYAFPGDRKGTVNINLKKTPDEKINLTIADNGVGISKNINIADTKSMGIKIIKTSAQQIKAKLNLDVENGTKWNLIF